MRHKVELDDRVRACVAGFDLKAMDHELQPDEKAAVREGWEQRLEGRYWSGNPEVVAFPWTEPDQILWDSERQAAEVGWRLVSPESCLKHRALLGPPAANRNARQFRFPSEMAFGSFDQGYLICLLDNEEVYQLDAASGAIWGALGTLGDVDDAGRYLSTLFDAEESTLAGDAASLLNQLLESGLLVRTTPDP
ncbi:MAG: PqqD family protein [Acidimicrobiia bacterium]